MDHERNINVALMIGHIQAIARGASERLRSVVFIYADMGVGRVTH